MGDHKDVLKIPFPISENLPKKPKEIKEIRSELDSVVAENKLLRERMEYDRKKRQLKVKRKKISK
jgi:regulator of replication initiation timing